MQCPACRADNPADARQCSSCGAKLTRRRRNVPEAGESAIRTWIDSSNRTAVMAYHCSLFAIIPFVGLVLGPVAVLLGLIGKWRDYHNPEERGGAQAMAAIILGSLTLLTNWTGLYFLLRGL
jgi:hypothetical protein